MSKLALKRLTASDLTFFEWHFRNHNAGNQKSINLNADVFVGQLFPSLPEIAQHNDGRLPVDLYLYGPGASSELNLQRKIIKTGSYKNWRLNGEFIFNPVDAPARFNSLTEGDIAAMEFNEGTIPTRVRVVLLGRAHRDDVTLHGYLSTRLGPRSMIAISNADLYRDISAAIAAVEHPIRELVLESDLEDAAQGGAIGARRLRSRRSGKRLFRSELLQAKRQAEENGLLGEELVNGHFLDLQDSGEITRFAWVSAENAVAPYDFEIVLPSGTSFVDVKSTTGDFERPIHVSLGELEQIALGQSYAIYRVYEMTENEAKLRVATSLDSIAKAILGTLRTLPDGTLADAVSIRPEVLAFGPEGVIRRRHDLRAGGEQADLDLPLE